MSAATSAATIEEDEPRAISPEQEDAPESMTVEQLLGRIVVDPHTCFGKPRVAGTRMHVAAVLEWMGAGESEDEMLRAFPYLTRADLRACLFYAAELARVKPAGMEQRVNEVWAEAMKRNPPTGPARAAA